MVKYKKNSSCDDIFVMNNKQKFLYISGGTEE